MSRDALATWGNVSLLITVGKDLEKGQGIRKLSEERINPNFDAKIDPNFPMGVL